MSPVALATLAVLALAATSAGIGWDLGRRRGLRDALDGPVWDTAFKLGRAHELYRIESEITGTPIADLIERDQTAAGDR